MKTRVVRVEIMLIMYKMRLKSSSNREKYPFQMENFIKNTKIVNRNLLRFGID
jgi:hypothetical protein